MSDELTTAGGSDLFDRSTLEFEGFRLLSRSVEAVGTPTLDQWAAAMEFACAAEEASPYWVGDLLNYSETRADWKDKVEQAMATTGLSLQTLTNRGYIARHVTPEVRQMAPSPAHVAEVAPLPEAEQKQWLTRAKDEAWTRQELRSAMRAAKRRAVVEGQMALDGRYRVVYADPPWGYGDNGATADGSLGKAERHYPAMTMADLIALPVAEHVTDDAVLFLWVTAPMLMENPGPRDIIEAWGFTPKTGMVWDKVLGNYGHYVHVQHEHLLICTRGKCQPDEPVPSPKSIFVERRSGEHSEKPSGIRLMIERLYPLGRRVELFAREAAPGWDCLGNDPRLWTQATQRERETR